MKKNIIFLGFIFSFSLMKLYAQDNDSIKLNFGITTGIGWFTGNIDELQSKLSEHDYPNINNNGWMGTFAVNLFEPKDGLFNEMGVSFFYNNSSRYDTILLAQLNYLSFYDNVSIQITQKDKFHLHLFSGIAFNSSFLKIEKKIKNYHSSFDMNLKNFTDITMASYNPDFALNIGLSAIFSIQDGHSWLSFRTGYMQSLGKTSWGNSNYKFTDAPDVSTFRFYCGVFYSFY